MSENELAEIELEFSHLIEISILPEEGRLFVLEPDKLTLKKLAIRYAIPKVADLRADIFAVPTSNGVRISGNIKANLVRECVASLEEMEESVDSHFELTFDRTVDQELSPELLEEHGIEKTLELLEGPEPLEGDNIDIGELMVQQLSLTMDPFPRKEGAIALSEVYGNDVETSPFDVLKSVLPDETVPGQPVKEANSKKTQGKN